MRFLAHLLHCFTTDRYGIGICFLHTEENVTLHSKGICFILISALCYAFYLPASERITAYLSSLASTTAACTGSALSCFLLLCLQKESFFPTSITGWFYIGSGSLIATATPIFLVLERIR
ncbi:hypothetical protein [Pajaroellobacter abortibovis]|uniref:EamA family transporter n=1 Tax=Pajaroellobacter abortibovis TaxID=1882918 RepID=UPI0012EBCA19|nr:hypothetical protein [Pajaroellobacter abortibovis]